MLPKDDTTDPVAVRDDNGSRACHVPPGSLLMMQPLSLGVIVSGSPYSLILFQSMLGLIMRIGFPAGAATFSKGVVPIKVLDASLTYVRISAFSALSTAAKTTVATCTRALNEPDVPLVLDD